MPTNPLTDEQAAQLQAKVTTLLTDKQAADTATANSNSTGAALLAAHDADSQAKIAEATADGQVSTDLNDLLSFISAITGTTITTTVPPPPAPTTPPTTP